jgi:hypothetical protein
LFCLEAFSEVYFNIEWLRAKLAALGFDDLLDDFYMCKENNLEVNAVYEALRLSEKALSSSHGQQTEKLLSTELTGRLLPYYGLYENITSLIDQCDRTCMSLNPIVPISQYIRVPCIVFCLLYF